MKNFVASATSYSRCSRVGALALLVLSSSCANKDVYQFRNSQEQQEQFKMEAVQGTYQGVMKSNIDGSVLGNLSLNVAVDTDVQPSSDGLTSELTATIHATATLTGPNAGALLFSKGYYDVNGSGHFKAQATVTLADNTTQELDLDATISGNQMTGDIAAEGYDDWGAQISLVKNGPAINVQGLKDSSFDPRGAQDYTTVASTVSTVSGNVSVTRDLQITFLDPNAEQRITNLIDPIRVAKVLVISTISGFNRPEPAVTEFKTAYFDTRTQTLTGVTTAAGPGGEQITYQLTCLQGGVGWNCTYTADGNPVQFVFNQPAKSVH